MLDEHHVFKSNIYWEKSEKVQVALSRFFLLFLVLLFSVLFFGPFGLLVLPYLCWFVKVVIPDPIRRNPFVRYVRK